jgi:ABC-type phosphate/phosphonate transport system substrate-binding protein
MKQTLEKRLMESPSKVVFFLALSLVFLGSQSRFSSADSLQTVSRHVRLGYSSTTIANIGRKDAKVALKAWADMTSREDGENFITETEFYDTLPEVVQAIRNGLIDMAVVSPMEYLQIRDTVPLEPFHSAEVSGSPYEEFTLLVHKDSGLKALTDLRDKRLLVEMSTTGKMPLLWLNTLLKKETLPGSFDFFGSLKEVSRTQSGAMAVFFKQTDACLVRKSGLTTMIELNPQIGTTLTPLMTSPPFMRAIVCIRPEYNISDRERLKTSALKLHQTPRGKQVLTLFRIDRIIPFDPALLRSTEALLAESSQLGLPVP